MLGSSPEQIELKAVLYDTPYKNPVQEVAYEGFRPIGEREVSGSICLLYTSRCV